MTTAKSLSEQLRAMDWQDIETAPIGEAIWVGHTAGLSYLAIAVKTTTNAAGFFWKNIYADLPIQWRPTHWRPLPSLPGGPSILSSAASALEDAERERDEARRKLFPYADTTEISGISWDGKYLIGDKASIKYFHEMKNRGEQIDVYRRAYEEGLAAAKAVAKSAEAKLAEAVKGIKWCLERDERNSSLPEAYAEKLRSTLSSVNGGQ